ncbi:unnamed protein product [Oikopleura dioica]|uniref:Uncharacterized protein n=1 Tax=Oikopleura dioica TaxID=34765 RepID=E4YJ32_OIKDI|nr:unnamed protein product [Oikopleura dioica]
MLVYVGCPKFLSSRQEDELVSRRCQKRIKNLQICPLHARCVAFSLSSNSTAARPQAASIPRRMRR